MNDDRLAEIRIWLESEKAGIAAFQRQNKEYPGHLAINICESLLGEIDRLRKMPRITLGLSSEFINSPVSDEIKQEMVSDVAAALERCLQKDIDATDMPTITE